jgi:hypothetical protein
LLALTFFVSMAFHQLAIVMWPALALGIYVQDGELSIKRRSLNTAYFSAVAAILIIAAYAILFYLASAEFSIQRLLSWAASYSPDADTQFNLWSNLRYSMRGHVRLFFGGRFNLLNGLINPLVIVLIICLIGVTGWLIFTALRRVAVALLTQRFPKLRLATTQKTVLLLSLLWTFVYIVFLFFWLPQNTFYRLFYLPGLIMLFGLLLASVPKRASQPRLLAAFVVALALANFLFLMYPFSVLQLPGDAQSRNTKRNIHKLQHNALRPKHARQQTIQR